MSFTDNVSESLSERLRRCVERIANRAAVEDSERSLKSSNAKSRGPLRGSDLVIDDYTRRILTGGGCDHAVSATT